MSTVESIMENSNAFDSNVYTEWALLFYLFGFVYMDLFVAIHVFSEWHFLGDIHVQSLNSHKVVGMKLQYSISVTYSAVHFGYHSSLLLYNHSL